MCNHESQLWTASRYSRWQASIRSQQPVFSPNNQLLPVSIISEDREIIKLFPQQPPIESMSQLLAAQGVSQDYTIDDDPLCGKKVTIHWVAIQEEVMQTFKDESILNCHLHITLIATADGEEEGEGKKVRLNV